MKGEMEGGGCSMCRKHASCDSLCRQHHWMHIIIKIFVALFIFWCGVQFGELKSAVRAAYLNSGYGMMNSYGSNRSQTYYVGPGMMSGWVTSTASEATTTKR